MNSLQQTPTETQVFNHGAWSRKTWWNFHERHRIDGRLRADAFDFISIHWHPLSQSFGLCSPMCLVEANGLIGTRPHWERYEFPTFDDAARMAKWIAGRAFYAGFNLTLIWCPTSA